MKDERLVAFGIDESGEVGLLLGGVDVRVAVVLETRKYRSRRISMLDGCTIAGSYGSSTMRLASTAALMSRSDSSMRGRYRPMSRRQRPEGTC